MPLGITPTRVLLLIASKVELLSGAASRWNQSRDNQRMSSQQFHLEVDARAREWLDLHPSGEPRVIAYEVHRCCGGGKICQVNVRELSRNDNPNEYAIVALEDGTKFLVDQRAASRLPSRFRLTARGKGPFKHLDLDLTGAQWGALLYERA